MNIEREELILSDLPEAPSSRSGTARATCGTRHPAPSSLRDAARADMVRVAPGRHAWIPAPWAQERVAKYVMCRWARQADGSYAPVPLPYRMVRMTPETTAMLGFVSGNRTVRADTLMRLAVAGFVDCIRISPHCWMLDLDSWFAHLSACMDDPEFWENDGEARRRYNLANGLGNEHGA